VNLVLAALTMALGLAIVVQEVVSPTAAVLAPVSLLQVIAGGIAFVLGLVWITATARLLRVSGSSGRLTGRIRSRR